MSLSEELLAEAAENTLICHCEATNVLVQPLEVVTNLDLVFN